jgi:hypothetical protein
MEEKKDLSQEQVAMLEMAKTLNEMKIELASFKRSEVKPESVVDPVEQAKAKLDNESLLRKKFEAEQEIKEYANKFDERYSSFLNQDTLKAINTAEMSDNHKFVRKVKQIFSNKDNLDLLPLALQPEAEKLLKLGIVEEASLDLVNSNINSLLKEFDKQLKQKEVLELQIKSRQGFMPVKEEKSRVEKMIFSNPKVEKLVNFFKAI